MVLRSLLVVLIGVIGSQSAFAQANVGGVVLDTSGAAVPGATVILNAISGAEVARQITDANGRFAFTNLAYDQYIVSASLDGFAVVRLEFEAPNPGGIKLVLQPSVLAEAVTVIGQQLIGSEEILRRTPGSYDVVTKVDLDRARVFTSGEALRRIPGVTVRDEEGVGLRPNIGFRGLNPTRSSKVLLLEDGLPVTYAPYGDNASYYHPPIERFDRIEVLKGSSQIAYGPVTLGGVVNYLTPDTPNRTSLSVDVTAGNRDYINAGVAAGGRRGKAGLFAHAVRKRANGSRENIASTLTDVLAKTTFNLRSNHQAGIKGNYYGEASQVTYSGLRESEYQRNPRQNPFANDRFDGRRFGGSATYQGFLWSRLATTLQAYGSNFSRDWWRQSSNSSQRPNDASDPLCGGMQNLNSTCGNEGRLRDYSHGGIEARGRLIFGGAAAQEIDFGARFHLERQDRRQENGATPVARTGVLVEDNRRTTDAASAFIQHRVMTARWTVTPGVRIEQIDYSRTNRLVNAKGVTQLTEVVPGVGMSYGWSPDVTTFVGVHRGFAPPRAEDIINNTNGGVVDLAPERSWNYEGGIRARSRNIQSSVTAFRLDYSNQIVPASVAGGVGATLTNAGQTLHQGLEAGINAEWEGLRGTRHGAYLAAAVTWLPVAKFEGVRTSAISGFSNVSIAGNRLPYAPEVSQSIVIGYRHASGLDMQIESQRIGTQFSDDLNTVQASPDGQRGLIDAYTYVNLTGSMRVTRAGRVFLSLKNVGDRTFIIDRVRGILPSHPRLLHVGATWRF